MMTYRKRLCLQFLSLVIVCGCLWLMFGPAMRRQNYKIVSVTYHPIPRFSGTVIAKSRLIVITVFPLIMDATYNTSNFGNITRAKLEQRMLDFLESVQHTLNHPLVSEVHIPYDQPAMPGYVTNRLEKNSKLKFDKLGNAYKVKDVLQYVHEKFQDQMVMITNGDIYPGEGLEKLDYDLMKVKRLFYSPSRHGRRETRCTMPPDQCDEGVRFLSSHDTYIFVPMDPLPTKASSLLFHNYWDSFGTENVILYAYHNYLNYTILNPCKVVFLYHNHCSNVRHTDRKIIQPKAFHSERSSRLQ